MFGRVWGMTGRILSAPRFDEWWIPAFAGMTKGYARVSGGGSPVRSNLEAHRMLGIGRV